MSIENKPITITVKELLYIITVVGSLFLSWYTLRLEIKETGTYAKVHDIEYKALKAQVDKIELSIADHIKQCNAKH